MSIIDPKQDIATRNRQKFLAAHGIDAANQHIAVATLNQVQDISVTKTDEYCIEYLRRWEKELRPIKPKNWPKWMLDHGAIFEAVGKRRDKIAGTNSLVYCYFRKAHDGKPETRKALEITFRVTPDVSGKGIFRLEVTPAEVPWPENVKITGA